MVQQVYTGATLKCSYGVTSSKLVVPIFRAHGEGTPPANITDFGPENITPFGMCSSPSNPEVRAATDAANGVLTPAPCTPVLTPWTTGGALHTLVRGKPALDSESKCRCAWAGLVEVIDPAKPEAQGWEQLTPFQTKPWPGY